MTGLILRVETPGAEHLELKTEAPFDGRRVHLPWKATISRGLRRAHPGDEVCCAKQLYTMTGLN